MEIGDPTRPLSGTDRRRVAERESAQRPQNPSIFQSYRKRAVSSSTNQYTQPPQILGEIGAAWPTTQHVAEGLTPGGRPALARASARRAVGAGGLDCGRHIYPPPRKILGTFRFAPRASVLECIRRSRRAALRGGTP
jgi:hypothetical protein